MKRICKPLSIIVLAIVMACVVVGCSKEPIVAVVNGEKISEPMYRIFLWSTERGLEAIVPNIWEIDVIEGKTPEEFAKERAIKSVTYYIAVETKANEANIKLSSDEKKEIKLSASQTIKDNKKFASEYGIDSSHFEKFLEYGKLEQKVINELGKTYVPNSEEILAAKEELESEGAFSEVATISHILFDNIDELGDRLPKDKDDEIKDRAESVLMSVLNGEDINSLALSYSDDKTVSENKGQYIFTKGEMESSIEEVVFELAEEGQVYPKLVETSMGYEIIKVEDITRIDEQQKEMMAIKHVRQDFITNELVSLGESYAVDKNEEYDNVHIMRMNSDVTN